MTEDLQSKVSKAILKTGFPLELEAAAVGRRLGWTTFHSVEYVDPFTDKIRELDLMFYKIINERRIELRISCKSSDSKQFVFFTETDNYIRNLGSLKITPACDDIKEHQSIPKELRVLPLYSHPRCVVNYTVLAGDRVDKEAKSLLRNAIMSAAASIHHGILPGGLLIDQRGTVNLFLAVLRGNMFEAQYQDKSGEMLVAECDYAKWSGLIDIPKQYWGMKIPDANGQMVSFSDAYYWFGSRLFVECIKDTGFERYLSQVESAFGRLNPNDYRSLGKPWTEDNFPKGVRKRPVLGQSDDHQLPDKAKKDEDAT